MKLRIVHNPLPEKLGTYALLVAALTQLDSVFRIILLALLIVVNVLVTPAYRLTNMERSCNFAHFVSCLIFKYKVGAGLFGSQVWQNF